MDRRRATGITNFYPEDALSPYVPLAACGPWIVTAKGAVVHDSGGYGMLGLGHNPEPVLAACARRQVMANVMTPEHQPDAPRPGPQARDRPQPRRRLPLRTLPLHEQRLRGRERGRAHRGRERQAADRSGRPPRRPAHQAPDAEGRLPRPHAAPREVVRLDAGRLQGPHGDLPRRRGRAHRRAERRRGPAARLSRGRTPRATSSRASSWSP